MLAFLRILGSGSSGNLAIVDLDAEDGQPPHHLLIDLGLGPRTLRTRLEAEGGVFDPSRVLGALITHADQDHLRTSWGHTITCHRWPVYASVGHHPGLARLGVPASRLAAVPDSGRTVEIAPGLAVTAAIAPHDDHGTSAYRLELAIDDQETIAIGWATDLGRFTDPVAALLEDCDVVAIESNYDPDLQARSPRPPFLKRRITSGHGHLSNDEAVWAVQRMSAQRHPSAIVLIHLSRDCNHPDLVRRTWRRHASNLEDRLHLAHATVPLPRIELRPGTPIPEAAPPVPDSLWA